MIYNNTHNITNGHIIIGTRLPSSPKQPALLIISIHPYLDNRVIEIAKIEHKWEWDSK